MASRIRHLTFDCTRPFELATFWKAALGYVDDPDDPNGPDDPEALIIDPKGLHPGLLFIPVPEEKQVKNRLHLDLVPGESRDAEVERLIGLGASLVDDQRKPDGSGWVVLADPEGNELCVERAWAERPEFVAPIEGEGRAVIPEHRAAGEREMLEAALEWYRASVMDKVAGVSPLHLRAQPGRSATSVAGLVKHLALVEDGWFHRLEGVPDPWADVDWDADPEWEFHAALDEPLDELLAGYRAACDRSRAIAGTHQLDDTALDTVGRPFSLRFVYVHMIEETARHLGHRDILRELLDGATGD